MNAQKKCPSLTDFKPIKLIFIRLSPGTLAAFYCWCVAILIRREDCSTFSPLSPPPLPELSDRLFPQNNPQERMREDRRLYIRRQKMGREHKEPNSWTEQEQERRGEEKQDGRKGRNNDEDNERGDDERSR